jgi:hypothetical protein
MKTKITGFIALFLMLFSFSFALAENETVNSSDVPMLISAPVEDSVLNETEAIDETEAAGNLFWKRAGIWFTFNQEKKAEKELKLAELQLIRARIAARNNNTQAMENALEAHKKLIERVQERVSKIENGNASEKLTGLDRAIQLHQTRIARFNAQLNNSNLSAEQIEKLQERIEKAQENTQHLREVADERRLEVRNKLRERNVSKDDSNDENETGDDNSSSDDLNDDSNKSEDSIDSNDDSNKTDDDSEDDASGTVLSDSNDSGNARS